MVAEDEAVKIAARRMILRDSAAFAILVCSTALLFAVTLFLFRSFTAHRTVLADHWSHAGEDDLKTNQPDAAVTALRTALTYAPGNRSYQLQLAQALSEANCAGCRDESYNYYLNLWDAEPGNGSINLALARLARQRKEQQAAINFYRASIYGTWEGNGVDRRASVRLELAEYLIEIGSPSSARLELLTAGTNVPDRFDRDSTIASLLQRAGYSSEALTYYQKALTDQPDNAETLDAAGRLAYTSGKFPDAEKLLARAVENKVAIVQDPQAEKLLQSARRLDELSAPASLPAPERIARILADRSIAKAQLDRCNAESNSSPSATDVLRGLTERWSSPEATATSAKLLREPALQEATLRLAFDTEIDAAKVCGPATGDDALLLTLATIPRTAQSAEGTAQFASPTD